MARLLRRRRRPRALRPPSRFVGGFRFLVNGRLHRSLGRRGFLRRNGRRRRRNQRALKGRRVRPVRKGLWSRLLRRRRARLAARRDFRPGSGRAGGFRRRLARTGRRGGRMGIRRRRGAGVRLRRRRPGAFHRARQGGAARPAHSFIALAKRLRRLGRSYGSRTLQEARRAVDRVRGDSGRRDGRRAQRALQDRPAGAGLRHCLCRSGLLSDSDRSSRVRDRQEPRREGRTRTRRRPRREKPVQTVERPFRVGSTLVLVRTLGFPVELDPCGRPELAITVWIRHRDSIVPLSHLPRFPASGNPQIRPLTWVLETGDRIAQRHPALQTYVRALSPRSRYNRFLGAVNELPASELARALAAKRGPCSSPRRPTASNGCSAMCCAPTRG